MTQGRRNKTCDPHTFLPDLNDIVEIQSGFARLALMVENDHGHADATKSISAFVLS